MKAFKLILSFAFSFLFFSRSYSQDPYKELEKLIKEGQEQININLDSSRIIFEEALKLSQETGVKKYESKIIGEIGKVYYYMNNIDSAILYFESSLDLSKRIKNYEQAGKMANNLGLVNLYIQEYEKSYIFFQTGLNYYIKVPDSIGIVDSYNNIGSYYLQTEKLDSAILNYKKSLTISKLINNLENIASVHTNLAIVYHTKRDFSKALKQNFKAAKIFEQTKDIHNLSITLGNIGALYMDNDNYLKACEYLLQAYNFKDSVFIEDYYLKNFILNLGIAFMHNNDFNKAEDYFQKALDLNKKNQDIKGEIVVYLNLCSLKKELKQNKEALVYGQKALKLSESINSEQYIASSCKYLGGIYNESGQYRLALKYLNIAYEKSIETEFLTYILDVLEEKKIAYSNLKDYKNAFFTDEKIIMFTDSLSGIETQKQLATLTTKYETEKKEQKIKQQNLEIANQKIESKAKDLRIQQGNIINISVITVVLLLLFLALILYRSIKQKKKANTILRMQKKEIEDKNEELHQQSEEILTQNEILIHNKEEIETQRDEIKLQRDLANHQKQEIISSITYAKRIQNAILPSDKYAKEILPEHFIFFKPRDIVSGDFYWMNKINNFITIATADCTGHGVPGAFMSMLGSSFLNEIVTKRRLDNAGIILDRLRAKVKKSLHQEDGDSKDGMDLAFYIIDTETLELQYAGAYNPLFIIRNKDVLLQTSEIDNTQIVNSVINKETKKNLIELKANRQPIAVHLIEEDFTNLKFQLHKGDCLYTFSDGYVDQFGGEKSSKFKTRNFKNLLLSITGNPMQEQKEILEKRFLEWKGTTKQTDDVIVMVVRI